MWQSGLLLPPSWRWWYKGMLHCCPFMWYCLCFCHVIFCFSSFVAVKGGHVWHERRNCILWSAWRAFVMYLLTLLRLALHSLFKFSLKIVCYISESGRSWSVDRRTLVLVLRVETICTCRPTNISSWSLSGQSSLRLVLVSDSGYFVLLVGAFRARCAVVLQFKNNNMLNYRFIELDLNRPVVCWGLLMLRLCRQYIQCESTPPRLWHFSFFHKR